MFKIVIADDEPMAREIIKLLLKNQPEVGEVIEAQDGKKALKIVNQEKPDIIFLDIQMPGMSGMQLAQEIPNNTAVIFVTAYAEYALEAFDIRAVDYLLKPFEDERFYVALEKALRQVKANASTKYSHILSMLDYLAEQKTTKFRSKLIVKEHRRTRYIDVDEINYITGAGNYAEIHLYGGASILHRETLSNLEEQLDPKVFIRIHRSSLVRRSSIYELKANSTGDFLVILKTGEVLNLSRRLKVKLEQDLNYYI